MQKTTCPNCGTSIDTGVQPQLSNNAIQGTLTIPLELLPSAMDALMIGRNASMMSDDPIGEEGLGDLLAALEAQIPPVALRFKDKHWARMVARARAGVELSLTIDAGRWTWDPDYSIRVCDPTGKSWSKYHSIDHITSESYGKDKADCEADLLTLRDILKSVAPLS